MHWFIYPIPNIEPDENLKKSLGRYFDILANRKIARFLIAKTISIEYELDSTDIDLWRKHSKAMKEFRKRIKDLDKNIEKSDDFKIVDHSLIDLKIEIAERILRKCYFCERRCMVDRKNGEKGFCGVGDKSYLSSEFLHMGEERCLIPSHTFFFIGCNFYCVYCQNWTISRRKESGFLVEGGRLAEIAKINCGSSRNINLVGGEPTPHLHTILKMLKFLNINIPIIWNSNMYMSKETMKILDGCVDVYLADFKYGNDKCAKRLSKVENYWKIVTRNHLLARKQAEILIRHLVLPNHIKCCTEPILSWIAKNLDNMIRLNIMGQYRPEFEAEKYKDINRRVSIEEMKNAFEIAKKFGLENLEL